MGAFKFFDKHLRGEERAIERAATKLFEPEELKVFDALPTDQRNTTIHETFTRRFTPPAIATKTDWNNQSSKWWELLREKVFPYWPDESAATSPPPRVVAAQKHDNLRLNVYEVAVHDNLKLPLFQIEVIGRAARKDADLCVIDHDGWRNYVSLWPASWPNLSRRISLPQATIRPSVKRRLTRSSAASESATSSSRRETSAPRRPIRPSSRRPSFADDTCSLANRSKGCKPGTYGVRWRPSVQSTGLAMVQLRCVLKATWQPSLSMHRSKVGRRRHWSLRGHPPPIELARHCFT